MTRALRDGLGVLCTLAAFAALYMGVGELGARDYLAAALMLLTGMAVLRAGVELLRPSVGE